MSAYLIIRCVIHDREKFMRYAQRTAGLVEKFGGQYVVRGGDAETLEGDFGEGVLVVSKWESREAAERFWNSDDYREAKALRQDNASADVVLVSGEG
ncbi:MAG: DUF1330 domain-containing protein [Gammaproteobacteria bacterium]